MLHSDAILMMLHCHDDLCESHYWVKKEKKHKSDPAFAAHYEWRTCENVLGLYPPALPPVIEQQSVCELAEPINELFVIITVLDR